MPAKNMMATGTLQRDSHYATNQWKVIEVGFVGKQTNAKDGYFGDIHFPDDISHGTLELQSIGQYGVWYSDGASHTMDFDSISITPSLTVGNIAWIKIPTTNITGSNSIVWLRLHLQYRVT